MQRRNEQNAPREDNSSGSTFLKVLFAGAAVGLTAFLGYQVRKNIRFSFFCYFGKLKVNYLKYKNKPSFKLYKVSYFL